MLQKFKFSIKFLSIPLFFMLLGACAYRLVPVELLQEKSQFRGMGHGMGSSTQWYPDTFDSNGERIYFTSSNDRGDYIRYIGGSQTGMMMDDYLSCASCHGPDARGGLHSMHMQVMDAPDIRYTALLHEAEEHNQGEDGDHSDEHSAYEIEHFRQAVIEGKHPGGDPLNRDMPRWRMTDQDLNDLFEFLKSLP
jgi:hypothetical protein